MTTDPASDTTHEGAIARARATAYGVALDGLGVAFDNDASPLTLLLLVQNETARAREVDAIAYTTAIDQIATYDRDNRPVDGSDGVLAGTARKAIDEGIRLWREANP